MRIHDLVQKSEAWHAFRLEHHGASEIAAALGLSKKVKRNELLHAKHTGIAREFSEWLQTNILDHGHVVEAAAREHVEAMIDDSLYPVTCSDGKLSASCDGLTLDGRIAWESKQWNAELAASVAAGIVPGEHMPQCQQILLVTGAEKVIFTVSDGTPEKMVHAEVFPDPEWFERIRAGWIQFDRDLAVYEPPAATAPTPSGKAPETLPALRIEVTGEVTASNLAEFKETALTAIRSVNRELSTDADFADAEKAVKWCSDVESRLAVAKEHALSQTASIDALFKTIDDISGEARGVRLELDKLVTRRKFEVKEGIILKAKVAYEVHVNGLKAETEGTWVALPQPDFAGAAKNKRTLASLQDAVDSVLANAKIEADASARRIRANLACLREDGAGHEFLFADKAQLVGKPLDDLRLLVKSRIDAHKAEEAARLEAERERIRAEETAKAQREAAAQAAAQEAARVAAERAQRDADELARLASVAARSGPATVVAQIAEQQAADARTVSAQPTAVPIRRVPATQAAVEPATLNLTAIAQRLGFSLPATFIAESLGIQHAATDKAAKLYRESQWPLICDALKAHIDAVSELQAA